MATVSVTDDNFEKEVLGNSKITLVDFWAPWCAPCKQLSPIVDEVATELANEIDVYKCNIDNNPETPTKFQVRGIPALMLFKDGELLDTKVGSISKGLLKDWIKGKL